MSTRNATGAVGEPLKVHPTTPASEPYQRPSSHSNTGQPSGDLPLLCDIPTAARLLSIGTTYCRRLCASGQLQTVRLGRRLLVPRAALLRLAAGDGQDSEVLP